MPGTGQQEQQVLLLKMCGDVACIMMDDVCLCKRIGGWARACRSGAAKRGKQGNEHRNGSGHLL
jgi:hypothetical protein